MNTNHMNNNNNNNMSNETENLAALSESALATLILPNLFNPVLDTVSFNSVFSSHRTTATSKIEFILGVVWKISNFFIFLFS